MSSQQPAWKKKTRPCPFYSQGRCLFADSCNFLHNVKIKSTLDVNISHPVSFSRNASVDASATPFALPMVTIDSPKSLRSPPRSPRMSSLLFALEGIIGPDDAQEQEDDTEQNNGQEERSVSRFSGGVSRGEDPFSVNAILSDTDSGNGSDEEDSAPASSETTAPNSDDHIAVEERAEVKPPIASQSRPEPVTVTSPDLSDNLSHLLSPVELTHGIPIPFPHFDLDRASHREDSLDSGYSENWVGPVPFALSPPPRAFQPTSTLELLASPFGSPSKRILPPGLGTLSPRFPPSTGTPSRHGSVESIDEVPSLTLFSDTHSTSSAPNAPATTPVSPPVLAPSVPSTTSPFAPSITAPFVPSITAPFVPPITASYIPSVVVPSLSSVPAPSAPFVPTPSIVSVPTPTTTTVVAASPAPLGHSITADDLDDTSVDGEGSLDDSFSSSVSAPRERLSFPLPPSVVPVPKDAAPERPRMSPPIFDQSPPPTPAAAAVARMSLAQVMKDSLMLRTQNLTMWPGASEPIVPSRARALSDLTITAKSIIEDLVPELPEPFSPSSPDDVQLAYAAFDEQEGSSSLLSPPRSLSPMARTEPEEDTIMTMFETTAMSHSSPLAPGERPRSPLTFDFLDGYEDEEPDVSSGSRSRIQSPSQVSSSSPSPSSRPMSRPGIDENVITAMLESSGPSSEQNATRYTSSTAATSHRGRQSRLPSSFVPTQEYDNENVATFTSRARIQSMSLPSPASSLSSLPIARPVTEEDAVLPEEEDTMTAMLESYILSPEQTIATHMSWTTSAAPSEQRQSRSTLIFESPDDHENEDFVHIQSLSHPSSSSPSPLPPPIVGSTLGDNTADMEAFIREGAITPGEDTTDLEGEIIREDAIVLEEDTTDLEDAINREDTTIPEEDTDTITTVFKSYASSPEQAAAKRTSSTAAVAHRERSQSRSHFTLEPADDYENEDSASSPSRARTQSSSLASSRPPSSFHVVNPENGYTAMFESYTLSPEQAAAKRMSWAAPLSLSAPGERSRPRSPSILESLDDYENEEDSASRARVQLSHIVSSSSSSSSPSPSSIPMTRSEAKDDTSTAIESYSMSHEQAAAKRISWAAAAHRERSQSRSPLSFASLHENGGTSSASHTRIQSLSRTSSSSRSPSPLPVTRSIPEEDTITALFESYTLSPEQAAAKRMSWASSSSSSAARLSAPAPGERSQPRSPLTFETLDDYEDEDEDVPSSSRARIQPSPTPSESMGLERVFKRPSSVLMAREQVRTSGSGGK
ncbi:hypothetical protein OF83DRAFT_580203 [Amylostereum chailletii]|nr:hypothetical protein OF83DRAFT_580203 [Amylostereum chailletii]